GRADRLTQPAITTFSKNPVTTSQENSPAPEVPRFECNGPHPPPRSLQTDRKAAPAHRILDRGNKTAPAAAALAVSSQPAISRRLAYNCWPPGRVFISPRRE